MKTIITFFIILFPWFIVSLLFNCDYNFYNSLELPFFAPPSIIFKIIWPILYILISYNIYKLFKEFDFSNETKSYYKILIVNYIANQLFLILFFCLRSTFLGFVDTLVVLITSLWLYYESTNLNKEYSKYLIPYIIWNTFATILSLVVYFMNL
jgi:tryptophan-rich sensory protein